MNQLARRYEVVLVTHAYFRSHLEPALAGAGLQVEVHYFQAPALGIHPHRQLNSRLYYSWWQWRVRRFARELVAERRFDLIHHLTWGTIRFPCFLGGLGVPLVMGPLGGGESAPLRLFKGLPFIFQAFEYLRSLSLGWVRMDPLAAWGLRRSDLILCKSIESLQVLPSALQRRAVAVPEIGSPSVDLRERSSTSAQGGQPARHKLLFAGRLLGWKGVALAVGVVAKLVRDGCNVQLDIAGDGPLRAHLQREIVKRGLKDRVSLLGNIPQNELLELYGQAALFIFPSLHDSSGNVVLESLSRGLPVVCLDLGGPKNYINEHCGIVVSTAGRSREQLEEAIAQKIAGVLANTEHLRALSSNAAEHAREQSWAAAVTNAYGRIEQLLSWSAQ